MASELRVDKIIPTDGVPSGGGGGMNHSYSFIGNGEQKINTPNEDTGPYGGNQGSSNLGKSELEQQYDRLMRERDSDIPKPAMRQ